MMCVGLLRYTRDVAHPRLGTKSYNTSLRVVSFYATAGDIRQRKPLFNNAELTVPDEL